MNTVIIILLITLLIVIARQIKSRAQRPGLTDASGSGKTASQVVNGNAEQSNEVSEDVWWKALSKADMLQLALRLALQALPVWEKYTAAQQITYRNSSAGPVNKIDSRLLQTAIAAMQRHSPMQFPAFDDEEINQYYNSFVNPVIALQDGAWSAPYPVKKVFLAVYNILKSILEQNSVPGFETYLSTAINQSIDCMEVSKLFSRNEILVLLDPFKKRL